VSGDVGVMVDRGVLVISELYRWLKDLLRVRLIDLARIRSELSNRLTEMQVYIPHVTFWTVLDITLYLDDDTYPELIKTELNISCEVSGDETALNSIKPDVTVQDFIRAFLLMDSEYVETWCQAHSSAPKEKDSILDKAIVTLWRNKETEINVGDHLIVFDLDRNFDVFDVNVAKGPFWCTYTLYKHHTLRFAIDLFKKYIDPLFNTQANTAMR